MWHLKLLGGAVLENVQGLAPARASRRHPLALLALLSTAPSQTRSRDKLIGLLWPELPEERGRARLRTALHALRKQLGPEAIRSVGDDLRLDPSTVQIDVLEFLEAIEDGSPQEAVELYRGPFLDGFYVDAAVDFDRWVEGERQRLAERFERALEDLARDAAAEGHFRKAAGWWSRLASAHPESGRQVVRTMEAFDAAGERARALQWAELHRRRMQTALVGKRALADIGLLVIGDKISQLADKFRQSGEMFDIFFRNAGVTQFQLKIGYQRAEVCIAAPLSVPVHGALYMYGTGFNGCQSIGHSEFTIIMSVNAQRNRGFPADGFDNSCNLIGHCATIGIAEHDDIGSRRTGSKYGIEGILRITLISVKKVFGIVNYLFTVSFQELHGARDDIKILFRCYLQGLVNVQHPAFSK